jgi:hypothetical protein
MALDDLTEAQWLTLVPQQRPNRRGQAWSDHHTVSNVVL